MNESKSILSTKFMRTIIAKIIRKAIFKKTGYEVEVQINDVAVKMIDGKMRLHADVDASMESDEFVDIVKRLDLI